MPDLDEELARAAAVGPETSGFGSFGSGSAGTGASTPSPARAGEPEDAPPRRSLGLLVSLLVMGVGLLVLVLTSLRSAVVYSKGVDELVTERARLVGRTVRVEGSLVKGTLVRRAEPCEYRFTLERRGQRLEVDYPQCSIPDTFRELGYTDVTVTAEGKLAADGRFAATQIMAKCPSKYEERARAAASATAGAAPPELPSRLD